MLGWHWCGYRVKHSASITYRKLTLPLVAATILANHAFN
jgi:hypothetical protein